MRYLVLVTALIMTLGLCPSSECAVSRWDEAYQVYRDKDYVKAVELFKTEAMAGNVEARYRMNEVMDKMTAEQSEKARELAEEYFSRIGIDPLVP